MYIYIYIFMYNHISSGRGGKIAGGRIVDEAPTNL